MARKAKKGRAKTDVDLLMEYHLRELGLVPFEAEYRFDPKRKWQFDYAFIRGALAENPVIKLAIEIEGGAFTRGRHVRGVGFVKDMEKYNAAAIAGFAVLRFTPEDIRLGRDLEVLRRWKVQAEGEFMRGKV